MSEPQVTPHAMYRAILRGYPRAVREHRGAEMLETLAQTTGPGRDFSFREAGALGRGAVVARVVGWRDHDAGGAGRDGLFLAAVLVVALLLRPVIYQYWLTRTSGIGTATWPQGWVAWAIINALWVLPLLALCTGRPVVAACVLAPVTAVALVANSSAGGFDFEGQVGRGPVIVAPLVIATWFAVRGICPRRPGWLVPAAICVSAIWLPMSFLNTPGGRQVSEALVVVVVVAAIAGLWAPRWALATCAVAALLTISAAVQIVFGDDTWNPSVFGFVFYAATMLLALFAATGLWVTLRRQPLPGEYSNPPG